MRANGRSTDAAGVPRIVFVSSHARLGGSEQVLEDLAGALPPGAVAGVVCLEDGPAVARFGDAGLPVSVLPVGPGPLDAVRAAGRLAAHVRRLRPDVVHANGVKAALVAVLAAPLARGVPVVWMKHDLSLDGPLARTIARRCAAVAAVSGAVGRAVAGTGRTTVVHPGVRVDADAARRDGEALRDRLGLRGPVVSVVGRLDGAKGHAELLELLPRLREDVPGTTALLVGGDDPDRPGVRAALEERTAALGVADAVRLPGHLPAAAVLAASDAVCVPTVVRPDGTGPEGFGLVAAQALALGTPVVAYDVGATGEVLGGCGRLVPAGDRDALRAALVEVLRDGAERARLADCGRRRGAELTVEAAAERMLRLYREAAA